MISVQPAATRSSNSFLMIGVNAAVISHLSLYCLLGSSRPLNVYGPGRLHLRTGPAGANFFNLKYSFLRWSFYEFCDKPSLSPFKLVIHSYINDSRVLIFSAPNADDWYYTKNYLDILHVLANKLIYY